MKSVKKSVEWELAGETGVHRGNLPLCPLYQPQIPHDMTWARTRAAVGSRQVTAWAISRPWWIVSREVNRNGPESCTKTAFFFIGIEPWGLFYRRFTLFLNSVLCRLEGIFNRFWHPKYLFSLQKIFTFQHISYIILLSVVFSCWMTLKQLLGSYISGVFLVILRKWHGKDDGLSGKYQDQDVHTHRSHPTSALRSEIMGNVSKSKNVLRSKRWFTKKRYHLHLNCNLKLLLLNKELNYFSSMD
jgi:hypothetical protein